MTLHLPPDETRQAHILLGLKLRPVDNTVRLPPKASLRAVMWLSKIVCECGHESLFLEAAEAHWRDAHSATSRSWFWKKGT
jgi:hypothetical protein